jgi:hypothetical protein
MSLRHRNAAYCYVLAGLVAAEKQQFIDDQRQRNAVEGKVGQGKRRFGLGLIREKLAVTQGSTIALNVLVMNLEKLLELLFVFFAYLLRRADSKSQQASGWGCRRTIASSAVMSCITACRPARID